MMRRLLLALPIGALALLAALPATGVLAQTPDPQGPVLVYQNLKDGDTITEPAFVIQLCFADPINIKDLHLGGDFAFGVTQPDNLGLGHRDVFQPDGYGIAVYPGNPASSNTTGEWTFTYRVTSPDAQHATTATIKYTVDPDGQSIPRETPPACVASGGTATVSPVPTGPTPTAIVILGSPSAGGGSATPDSTPTPIVTRGPVEEEDDGDGPDILKLALITVGLAGGAGLLALVGYFVRRRVGYEPHKPKSGDGDGGHH